MTPKDRKEYVEKGMGPSRPEHVLELVLAGHWPQCSKKPWTHAGPPWRIPKAKSGSILQVQGCQTWVAMFFSIELHDFLKSHH